MDEILRKHCAFWERAPDSVLIGDIGFTGWRSKPFPTRRGEITSPAPISHEDIDPLQYVGMDNALPPLYSGDMIKSATCVYPECWLEGMIGCDVYASEFSLSAKPVPGAPDSLMGFSARDALSSGWARLLTDTQRAAVKKAGESHPALQAHFRGVVDMLAASLGESELCMAVYDSPGQLDQLAGKFVETWLGAAELSQSLRPRWRGGRASSWGVFAPGELIDYQIDASSLFSPSMYNEVFLPYDRQVLRQFEYNVVHLHACGLRHVPAVAEINGLRCVEINLDKEANSYSFEQIERAVSVLQRNNISVIIYGELSDDEVELYLSSFERRGLAIFHWTPLM